jgi:hypothetical protein
MRCSIDTRGQLEAACNKDMHRVVLTV